MDELTVERLKKIYCKKGACAWRRNIVKEAKTDVEETIKTD